MSESVFVLIALGRGVIVHRAVSVVLKALDTFGDYSNKFLA